MRKVNVSNSLRKLFSIIMVSIFIIAAMPVDYIRADEPVQDGSKSNPYIVTNFKEFQNGIMKQGYIKLANDIDFSEYIYMEVDSSYRGGIDLNGHILNFEKRYSYYSYGIGLRNESGAGGGLFEITDSNPSVVHEGYVNSENEPLTGGIITGFRYNMNSSAGGSTSCLSINNLNCVLDGVTFFDNTTGGGGSCIDKFGENGTLEINKCKFYDNKSNYWASCVWVGTSRSDSRNDQCLITDSVFKGNYGKYTSTVATSSENCVIKNCLFENNECDSGGTVNVSHYGTLEVVDTDITGNICTSDEEDDSTTAGICIDVCGKLVLNGKVNITGHTLGDWIIDKPATVETAGSRHKECETCGAILEKEEIKKLELPAYKIIDGAESTWTQNTNTDGSLVIRGDGAIAKFKEVRVDGVVIDVKNYTVTEGSTIITLKTEYLKTLPAGKHTFEIAWIDGSAATYFTVAGSTTEEDNKVEDNTIDDKKAEDNNVENSRSDVDSNASLKTGDTTDIRLWLILLMSALTIMTGLTVKSKRNDCE